MTTPIPKARKAIVAVIPLLLVWAYVFYVVQPALNAWWSLQDDHEVAQHLGARQAMSWHDAFSDIRSNALTAYNRFLPLFYAVRVLETKLRGLDPFAWHVDRVALAFVAAASLYVMLATFLRPFSAGVVTLMLFSGPTNTLWINLAFPETYALVLTLLGGAWMAVSLRRESNGSFLRLFPGFVLIALAGMCKESFVAMLPAALVIVYVIHPRLTSSAVERPRARTQDRVAITVLTLVYAAVVAGHAVQYLRHGHYYKGGFRLTSSLSFLSFLLERCWLDTGWPVAVLAAVCTVWFGRAGNDARALRQLLTLAAALACGFALFVLPQAILYGTTGQQWDRYLVPGTLFALFAAGVSLYRGERAMRHGPALTTLACIALAGAAVATAGDGRRRARDFAKSSHEFRASLEQIVALKRQHVAAPLVFHGGLPSEFEPLIATRRWLSIGPTRDERVFLVTPAYAAQPGDPLGNVLAESMMKLSAQGGSGFTPAEQLPPAWKEGSVNVSFRGSMTVPGGQPVVFMPPAGY